MKRIGFTEEQIIAVLREHATALGAARRAVGAHRGGASRMLVSLALVCAVGIIGPPALAQGRTTIQDAAPGVMLAQTPEFAELIGRWVRTDGGYTIVIKSVDPNGKIDATYANPNPINISRAEASVEGNSLRIFIELRGAGYPGSTYTLTHVRTGDRLTGEYFQAAIRQKFDVIFLRAR